MPCPAGLDYTCSLHSFNLFFEGLEYRGVYRARWNIHLFPGRDVYFDGFHLSGTSRCQCAGEGRGVAEQELLDAQGRCLLRSDLMPRMSFILVFGFLKVNPKPRSFLEVIMGLNPRSLRRCTSCSGAVSLWRLPSVRVTLSSSPACWPS